MGRKDGITRKTGIYFFLNFLIAFLYVVTGKLSFYYTIESLIVTISVFFPEGFALGFVLIFGPAVVPGIFIGQLLLAYIQGFSLLPSSLIALGNSAEALMAYYLLKAVGFDTRMQRIGDVGRFIGVVVFVLQPFSALIGSTVLYHFRVIEWENLSTVMFAWWFGNLMGQLLLTPLLLLLYHMRYRIYWWKMAAVGLLFGILSYFFIYIIPVENGAILFSITIVPLVLMLSFRNGLVYALFAIVVITLIAIYTANHHIGPFSIYDERTNLINLNFYILAHILTVLIIGVLFIEKNSALDQYAALNRGLEQRIAGEVSRNREKDRLMFFQGRLAQVGEMIALIVHQWKQPLNNLSLINQSLAFKHRSGKLDTEAMEQIVADSQKQIDTLVRISEELKSFFRQEKEKRRFLLNDTICHVVELLQPALENASITLEQNCEQKVWIEGYPNEFAQAIMNIINNAKDALTTSDTLIRKISVQLEEDDRYVVLTIQDNAGGIPHEIIDKIFDPYFTTKKEKEGTGLGLYLSRMIIENYMGGKINVYNDTQGAVFEIVFEKEW